ncbi:MAG: hypothetical protein KAW12_16520 [Candidatus Aminicenantes bacterium]|nr:hypothetical protein [Candidatus Aminicenantes bacterium]
MSQVYKEKILRDIDDIPVDMLPKFYKIVHLLKKELIRLYKPAKRNSLKGIWKGSEIDDRLFDEAKKSLFHYE